MKGLHWGCLGLVIVVLLWVALGPIGSTLVNYTAERRAKAETALLYAKAQTATVEMAANAGAYALRADTRRAHPELLLEDAAKYVCLPAIIGLIGFGAFLLLRGLENEQEKQGSKGWRAFTSEGERSTEA